LPDLILWEAFHRAFGGRLLLYHCAFPAAAIDETCLGTSRSIVQD